MNPRERNYYEVGWRHGRDARAGARANAQLLRESLSQALRVPQSLAVARVVADYERRLESLPSLIEYPELRGMRECVLAYNRGVAEGADTSLTDVILRANYLHVISGTPVAVPGCTLAYFPASDRGPLVANNNDGTARWKHADAPTWIVSNRAGLIVGCVSSGIFDDEVSPEQFPAPVYLMADELCGTFSEAVDLLTRLNYFWGPCNALIADRQGHSAVIEKSSCRYGLRKSADGFAATTEMSAEEPAFKSYLWETRERSLRPRGLTHDSADWAYWQACERRSARLHRLVEAAKAEPTFATMERIIYDHTGQPEQVHMDGSKCHPDQAEGEWSLRTTIWVVDELAAQYSFAEPPVSGHLTPRRWKQFASIDPVF